MIILIVAVLGGIAAALQSQSAGTLDRMLGTLESVFITYAGGAVLVSLWVLSQRGGNFAAWRTVPKYCWLAGFFGLVIVGSIAYTVPRMGLANAMIAIVASQLFTSVVVDHYGLLGATVRQVDGVKIVGLTLICVGAWLTLK
jgi:transporter family-2 protein